MLTTTLPEGRSNHMPEAVPKGLGSTVHPSGQHGLKPVHLQEKAHCAIRTTL